MLAGTLCGVEMALALAGVPFTRGGVDAGDGTTLMASRRSPSPAAVTRRGSSRAERVSRPLKRGGRFARNAATPSLKSWLA